jgi:hypothetical protein
MKTTIHMLLLLGASMISLSFADLALAQRVSPWATVTTEPSQAQATPSRSAGDALDFDRLLTMLQEAGYDAETTEVNGQHVHLVRVANSSGNVTNHLLTVDPRNNLVVMFTKFRDDERQLIASVTAATYQKVLRTNATISPSQIVFTPTHFVMMTVVGNVDVTPATLKRMIDSHVANIDSKLQPLLDEIITSATAVSPSDVSHVASCGRTGPSSGSAGSSPPRKRALTNAPSPFAPPDAGISMNAPPGASSGILFLSTVLPPGQPAVKRRAVRAATDPIVVFPRQPWLGGLLMSPDERLLVAAAKFTQLQHGSHPPRFAARRCVASSFRQPAHCHACLWQTDSISSPPLTDHTEYASIAHFALLR